VSTTGVAFGQRVVLLQGAVPVPNVPARLLLPGDGRSFRMRASTAALRPDPYADVPAPKEILIPGRPGRDERVRASWLGRDPARLDVPVARRLGVLAGVGDVRRYEVLGEWGRWRHRVAQLSEVTPGAELAALLESRPSLADEPTGGGLASGLGSLRVQLRLDSMAARQRLISALQGEQFADAAALAVEYSAEQEFLAAETALALGTPESVAGALLSTAFTLATKLPGTLAALRRGQILPDVASVIVGATAVVTDASTAKTIEESVLPTVAGRSRESIRRQVCRQIIRSDPASADARHQLACRDRTVTRWAGAEGMGWLKVHAPAQDIATVWETLSGLADAVKTPGDARTIGQRRTDVLCAVFQSVLYRGGWSGTYLPVQHGRRPHVEVLIPHHVLDSAGRGAAGTANGGADHDAPRSSDVCELVGYGPIAARQALTIAAEGVWRRLVCDPLSGTLLDYGRTRYHPPDTLKQFVVTRDQQCAAFGCSQPAWRCDVDHAQPFSAGGPTSESNLSALCRHHHRAKDGGGWSLTINADRSKTWTTPLGRARTEPPTRLIDPVADRSAASILDEPAPF